MSKIEQNRRRGTSARRASPSRAVLTILLSLVALLASTGVAGAAWEAPVQIAPSSQTVEGGGSAAAALGLYEGNAVIAYRPSEQSIAATHRDKGTGAYSSAQTLGTTSGSNKLASPGLAVGAGGQALAAWVFETPKTSEEAVPCATRAAAATTFSPCASNLFGPPGLFEGNWRMGSLRAAGGAAGTAAVTFEGPGGSNGYNFSRPFGAYGSLSGTPATVAVSGNTGEFESGRETRPQVALNAAGDAITAWTGWPGGPQRTVEVGYRDHAGSGWTVRGGGTAAVYCCSNLGPGSYRVALDAAGDAYVIIGGGNEGNAGETGVVFAYASRAYALGGTGGWGVQQQLDAASTASQPRLAVDSAGNATAIWIDQDPETHHDALFAAYRPAGTATTFGSAVEVTLAPGSGQINGDELFVDPAGHVMIAWTTCLEAGCANHELQARTRATGGGAFSSTETIVNSETSKSGLALAGDPQGDVLLAWRESGSGTLYASMYSPPAPPAEGDGTGSSGTGSSDTSSSDTDLGLRPVAATSAPRLTLLGKPRASADGATFTVSCHGSAGQSCDTTELLTATERLRGGRFVGLSSRKRRHASTKRITLAATALAVPGGQHKTILLTLNDAGRKLLARFHRLAVTLTVMLTNGAGGKLSMVAKRTFVIRSPKQRKRRH